MEKNCRKCGEKFITYSIGQEYCSNCKKTLVCCVEGCNKPVRVIKRMLCDKHRYFFNRDENKKECKKCKNLFIPEKKYQWYCNECLKIKCKNNCGRDAFHIEQELCKPCYLRQLRESKKVKYTKNCKECNNEFITNQSKQIFCCNECKVKNDINKHLEKNRKLSFKKQLEIGYKNCEICGNLFLPKLFYGLKQHCCSKECREIYENNYKKELYKKEGHLSRGKSFPQTYVYNTIKEYFSNYEWKYNARKIVINPETNYSLEIDIYCIDKKFAVEVDGGQHYYPKYGQKIFEYTIKMDKLKEKLCKEKGIKLIRISCDEDWKDKNWIINLVKEAIDGDY